MKRTFFGLLYLMSNLKQLSIAGYSLLKVSVDDIRAAAIKMVPPMDFSQHKGQAARIGVVGGSVEYTGAPYYAARASLTCGGDLATVFCAKEAAIPIKCYSPELMVIPLYSADSPQGDYNKQSVSGQNSIIYGSSELHTHLDRLHCLVIGPGLGRSNVAFEIARKAIHEAVRHQKIIVIDADALFLLSQDLEALHIQGYSRCILTPNAVEFSRLVAALPHDLKLHVEALDLPQQVLAVSQHLGGVTILRKGLTDIIAGGSSGEVVWEVIEGGSPRRCGGQGDLLAGALSVAAFWSHANKDELRRNFQLFGRSVDDPLVWAGLFSSILVRRAAVSAFERYHRSTSSVEILSHMALVLDEMVPLPFELNK